MNNRQIGNNYEDVACRYLDSIGYEIITRNFRCKLGEIDIIAKDAESIVFIEVKYRSSNNLGYPEEAVSKAKQRTIISVAKYYILINRLHNYNIRFDVIACYITGEINHIKNAFGGI